jgi:tetratricopeptide (TPR) repeat protein
MIRDAIDLVRDMGPTPALAEARYAMGRRLELVERRDEATVHLAEAADLFERSGQLGRAAATMVLWGRIELDLGEVMRSTDIVDDALLLVGESNDDDEIATCCDVLSLGAELDLRNWNNVRAAERLTRLLTLSERCGRPTAEPRAKLAVVLGRTGELDRALELIDAVADDIASQGTYSDRVRALVGEDRAQVLRQAGRLADATEVAREAAGFARAGGDRMLEMRLRRAVADHTFAAWTGTWQESDWADDWDDEDEDDEAGTGASDPPTAMRDRGDPALRDAVIASTRAVFEVEAGDQLLEPRERDYLRRRLDDLGE